MLSGPSGWARFPAAQLSCVAKSGAFLVLEPLEVLPIMHGDDVLLPLCPDAPPDDDALLLDGPAWPDEPLLSPSGFPPSEPSSPPE